MSEINYIEELPEGVFPVNISIVYQYQRKYSSLMDKYKTGKYKISSFHGVLIRIL